MTPLCIGWGFKSTWNVSHLPSNDMKGVWQPSYAVDGDMGQSSCWYHRSCCSRFWKSAHILGHCLKLNEATVHWLRLQTHMEWFPPPLQWYERCLTTFMGSRGASLCSIGEQAPRGALFRWDLVRGGKWFYIYSYVISTCSRKSSRSNRRPRYGFT